MTIVAKAIIAIGSKVSVVQPAPDKFIVAIKPTRARCAADIINSNIGHAAKKPMPVAVIEILATMICIWWAIKPSEAPIWFSISSSRRCNIAVLRVMYDMHTAIVPSIINSISPDANIMYVPVVVDDFSEEACGKKRAYFDICSENASIASVDLNFISHILGR